MNDTTMRPCQFPIERLVAWRDGVLRGAPLEITEAHIALCPDCSAWLCEMDMMDEMLRSATPLRDDPERRSRIKKRVDLLPPPSAPRVRLLYRARLATVTLLVLAVITTTLIIPGPLAESGSSLTRWLSTDRTLGWVRDEDAADRATAIVAPDIAGTPTSLPFGLSLVENKSLNDTSTQRTWTGDDGLAIAVIEDRGGDASIQLQADPTRSQIYDVLGKDVLVLYGLTPADVASVSWEEDDALIMMLVLTPPRDGLTPDEALLIVAALIAEP